MLNYYSFFMQTTSAHFLIACPDCDLLYRRRPLRDNERATCCRCGAVLYRKKPDTLNRTLTHSLTNLVLFVLANIFPFMSFQLQGREQVTFLTSGGIELFRQGFWGLGFLVLAFGVAFPLLKILGTLYVLIPLKFNRCAWKAKETMRLVVALTPWAMMEVLMLGVIVGYVKLIDLAAIVPGVSLYCFAALIVCTTMAAASFDPVEIWDRLITAK